MLASSRLVMTVQQHALTTPTASHTVAPGYPTLPRASHPHIPVQISWTKRAPLHLWGLGTPESWADWDPRPVSPCAGEEHREGLGKNWWPGQHVFASKPTIRSAAAGSDSFQRWSASSLSTLAHVEKCAGQVERAKFVKTDVNEGPAEHTKPPRLSATCPSSHILEHATAQSYPMRIWY